MPFEERKKLIKWLKPTELSHIFINYSIQETNRKDFLSFFLAINNNKKPCKPSLQGVAYMIEVFTNK